MNSEYEKGGGTKKDHVILNASTCFSLDDTPYSQLLLLLLEGNMHLKFKMR